MSPLLSTVDSPLENTFQVIINFKINGQVFERLFYI